MTALTLPHDGANFTREALAVGRYRDMAEVIPTWASQSQRAELTRAAFVRSLEEAEAHRSDIALALAP